jgi:hypothetical protein
MIHMGMIAESKELSTRNPGRNKIAVRRPQQEKSALWCPEHVRNTSPLFGGISPVNWGNRNEEMNGDGEASLREPGGTIWNDSG